APVPEGLSAAGPGQPARFINQNNHDPGRDAGPAVLGNIPDLAGNAQRLIAMHGEVIRYGAAFNTRYLWNGNVLVRDETGRMLIIATTVTRSIHREAAVAPTGDRSHAPSHRASFSGACREKGDERFCRPAPPGPAGRVL
ncbi:MAG: hypothetical protein Q7T80_16540, partial [Methanoregula sp.]|nr:hypothetical protein [Methanoregula sp.]